MRNAYDQTTMAQKQKYTYTAFLPGQKKNLYQVKSKNQRCKQNVTISKQTCFLTMEVTMSRACTSIVISAHSTARASLGSSPRTIAASLFKSCT